MAILTGLLLGFSTLIFIGPVLFYLLKSSMQAGFKAGVFAAMGIITGDIICAFLAFFGVGKFLQEPEALKWVSLIGGFILITIGLKYILERKRSHQQKQIPKEKKMFNYYLNGFLINFINPFVLAIWIGFVAYNRSLYSETMTAVSLFCTLLVIFSTDLLKAYYSRFVLNLVQPNKLSFIFLVFGWVMLTLGLRLIYGFFR